MNNYETLEVLFNEAIALLEKLEPEVEEAFSTLEMYGIPRKRAKTIANGIQVFDSRMQKEVRGLEYENAALTRTVDLFVDAFAELKACSDNWGEHTVPVGGESTIKCDENRVKDIIQFVLDGLDKHTKEM